METNSNLTPMILDESEVYLIKKHRQVVDEARKTKEMQDACNHTWKYDCSYHNDTWYSCSKCGATVRE